MKNVIVDILHMFLRISGKLFDIMVGYIEEIDLELKFENERKEKERKEKEKKKINKKKNNPVNDSGLNDEINTLPEQNAVPVIYNLEKLINYLESINIKRPYNTILNKFRDFNGDEYIKIYKKINFVALFPTLKKSYEIQKTWDEFYRIILEVKNRSIHMVNIKTRTEAFFENFRKIAFDSLTTPYIHIFISHLFEQATWLQSKDFCVNDFSMQGIEKLNDSVTKYYQRSTNKKANKKNPYLRQILLKRSRVEILKHHNNLNLLLK